MIAMHDYFVEFYIDRHNAARQKSYMETEQLISDLLKLWHGQVIRNTVFSDAITRSCPHSPAFFIKPQWVLGRGYIITSFPIAIIYSLTNSQHLVLV